MTVLSTRGGKQPPFPITPEQIVEMRQLWESREMPARLIAERFNVTKNAVIGHAHRKGWEPRGSRTKEPTTLPQRLDALHAKLHQVLAETRPFVEGRTKLVIADPELAGVAG